MRTREVGFGSNENQTKTQIILGQIFKKFDSLLLECIGIHLSFCFHCKWIPFILIDRKSEETFIHSFELRIGIVLEVIQIGVHLRLNRHAN